MSLLLIWVALMLVVLLMVLVATDASSGRTDAVVEGTSAVKAKKDAHACVWGPHGKEIICTTSSVRHYLNILYKNVYT